MTLLGKEGYCISESSEDKNGWKCATGESYSLDSATIWDIITISSGQNCGKVKVTLIKAWLFIDQFSTPQPYSLAPISSTSSEQAASRSLHKGPQEPKSIPHNSHICSTLLHFSILPLLPAHHGRAHSLLLCWKRWLSPHLFCSFFIFHFMWV